MFEDQTLPFLRLKLTHIQAADQAITPWRWLEVSF
jgi:hypothetical protein